MASIASISKTRVIQIITGALWVLFGLNGFLDLIAMPPPPPQAQHLLAALAASGYFFPMVKACELIGGLALLTNKAVNFALVLLAPIIVNILALHFFLDPAGLLVGILLTISHVFLVVSKWGELKVIFKL